MTPPVKTGPGRPTVEKKDRAISVRVPEELAQKIEKEAKSLGLTPSSLIRMTLTKIYKNSNMP